jgi:hypothetical protein
VLDSCYRNIVSRYATKPDAGMLADGVRGYVCPTSSWFSSCFEKALWDLRSCTNGMVGIKHYLHDESGRRSRSKSRAKYIRAIIMVSSFLRSRQCFFVQK